MLQRRADAQLPVIACSFRPIPRIKTRDNNGLIFARSNRNRNGTGDYRADQLGMNVIFEHTRDINTNRVL
jgi:hypothetical protein